LFPPIEVTALGVTIPSPFIPGLLVPGLLFGVMTVWPFIESRVTKDSAEHNLLDRPRDRPLRTALGVAGLLVFVMLTLAGGNDVAAIIFNIPVETMTNVLRAAVFVVPLLGFALTYRVCLEMRARDLHPLQRSAGVLLRRTPEGGFEEVPDAEVEVSPRDE
ncbi:MAG: ubiquinol-cytochrome c reductase cytochrome b subunit, partial [Chloroflexota bacterium]|nr:ubiquinol-cytochrome c reductase cytochrome b subunit [Chloroflexota bacterium]